jgi:ABC-type lipoprotein export system ATPase subunit
MTTASVEPNTVSPTSPPALLTATGVRRTFRMGEAELSVLRAVDFDLRPGEFVAIEGRSGSGKSTLLHVLAALDAVDGGELTFDGRPYTRRSPASPSRLRVWLLGGRGEGSRSWWFRVGFYILLVVAGLVSIGLGWSPVLQSIDRLVGAKWADPSGSPWPEPTALQWQWARTGVGLLSAVVLLLVLRWAADVWAFARRLLGERPAAVLRNKKFGFVFQSYHLLPELNVLENTMLAPEIEFSWLAFRSRRAALRRRATDLLAQLGMGDRLKHRPSQLSGGERQRVAIARALMNEPAVLFADEPTGNLDVETGRQIMDLIEALHRDKGQTIIMVTHDRSLAREADRVLVLKDGRLEPAV